MIIMSYRWDDNSVVDSFKRRGEDSSFANRERVFYNNYGYGEKYTGSGEQNERMNRDVQRGNIYFGHFRCCEDC